MFTAISLGKFRKRVQIQTLPPALPGVEQDLINGWQTQATRWASIEPLSGRELIWAAQIAADVTHRVTLPYYVLLVGNSKARFQYVDPTGGSTRIFQIESVLNLDEKNRWMVCLCKEQVI